LKYDGNLLKRSGLHHEKRRSRCNRGPDDFTDSKTHTCAARHTSYGSCRYV